MKNGAKSKALIVMAFSRKTARSTFKHKPGASG